MVTIHRAGVAACVLWGVTACLYLVGWILSVYAGHIDSRSGAAYAWGVFLTGVSVVVSVKYLLDKHLVNMLDEVALLHHERDASWRKAIEDGDCPPPAHAPPVKRIGSLQHRA